MVLPLIPLALVAAGAVSGGGGLALGGKGALSIKKAKNELDEARHRYQDRRARSEANLTQTNHLLENLGRQQEQAITEVVLQMADFLRRHEKQVRENERLLVDGIEATISRMRGLGGLDVDAASWVVGAMGSAAAGASAGMGVTAAVGTFGVASTGAAISGLSGAAAESATMAFLGGGSLAAGGGGVALGAAALNFVTIGTALLVGGFVAHGQGNKAVTKAREFSARIAVEIAKLDQVDAKLSAVDARTDELSSLLTQLRDRAVEALDLLESEPFDPKAHAARFQHALTLTVAVRDIATAPILDSEGDLTERSANLTVKYRTMTEADDNAPATESSWSQSG